MSTDCSIEQQDMTNKVITNEKLDISMCNLCVFTVKNKPFHDIIDWNVKEWKLCSIKRSIKIEDIEHDNLNKYPILLRSNNLIDSKIGKQLNNLIKPLRNQQFINDKTISNPKVQELIPQFQHFKQYKQLKSLMEPYKKLIISWDSPIIIPEFRGLPYVHDNYNKSQLRPAVDITFTNQSNININTNKLIDVIAAIGSDEQDIGDEYDDRLIPICLVPTIFSLDTYSFMTEINGLLFKNNVILYSLIENIFIK
eukprot:334685_1